MLAAVLAAMAVGAGACGGDEGEVSDQAATTGHATLEFEGAVRGTVDADVEVACYPPNEEGDPFTVSVDAERGIELGGQRLQALDFSIPDYDQPGTYDVAEAVRSGSFDAGDYFLLFEELAEQPFRWGEDERSGPGSITIDGEGTSGHLSLAGWENAAGQRVDVEGTFRCGRKPER